MTPKWKAFTLWLVLPDIFCLVALVLYSLLHEGGSSIPSLLFDWSVQRLILVPSVITAALGTVVLWRLTIRQRWSGMLVGLTLAPAIIGLCTFVEMFLWGGFEEDGGIFLAALALTLPSCVGGVYAGFLRSRVDQPKRDDASGWWPHARS